MKTERQNMSVLKGFLRRFLRQQFVGVALVFDFFRLFVVKGSGESGLSDTYILFIRGW